MIGEVIRDLGGGRLTKESRINYDVGIDSLAKAGERVQAGSCIARIHAADKAQAEGARARIAAAIEISPEALPKLALVAEVVSAANASLAKR